MSILNRTSAAPISWGICEVPNWGIQLPVRRVLNEMQQVGFSHTELGSAGYLPTDPKALVALLGEFDLKLSGSFVPSALHDADRLDGVRAQAVVAADLLASGGGENFITCVVSDPNDWFRFELARDEWQTMLVGLEWLDEMCHERGLRHVIHPHVDSLVETEPEIQRVVDNTPSDFVLETGHLAIGGYEPSRFVANHADRVGLVHLKDLDMEIAAALNADNLTLMQAVQAGLFPPLGDGDLPLADIIGDLESTDYDGWYVIEQDVAITKGEPPIGAGPVIGVRKSLAFLARVDSDRVADG